MAWDPDRYARFQSARTAPFDDLVPLINVRPGMSVVDLGCGPGDLTRRLAGLLPDSRVAGIDSSAEMLGKARLLAGERLTFKAGSMEEVTGEWDLVFSHAALHWVGNHSALVPHLMGLVRPGGQLVVQVPSNHRHPSHTLIIATAAEEPFRSALAGWVRISPVLEIDEYADLLFAAGGEDLTVFEKVYPVVMEHADGIADWTAGTTLVPYFERLPKDLHEPFLASYRSKLRELWPEGPVFFPFRRILFAASRPARPG